MFRVLAQVGFEPPAFDLIDQAPLAERIFLEQPLPLAFAFVVLGLLLAAWYLRRAEPKRALFGLIPIGLGVALFLIGHFVTTDRQRVADTTRDLISAIASPDPGVLRQALSDGAEIRAHTMRWRKEDLIELVRRAEAADGAYDIPPRFTVESYRIRQVRAALDSPTIARTQVNVTATANGRPQATWWELDFDRTPDGWKVRTVTLKWLAGLGNIGAGPGR